MNLNIVTSGTLFEATKETLKKIDYKNLEQKNLVVVPDSFSMQAENLIFDSLNIKSTFNISVVGISRLASKILKEHNIPFDRVSGLEEILLTYKAVKDNEENFSYFQNYGIDFCLKVKEILSQFSNCFVKVEDIKTCDDEILSKKMTDLKLIYASYLDLLSERLNLSKLLAFFLEKSDFIDLKNYNLYFVNFDSFSKEIFDFVCQLSKKVNSIYISLAKPIWQGNAYIYEDDALNKMMKYASSIGVMVKVEEKKISLEEENLKVLKNVFSIEQEKSKGNIFRSIVASDRLDEIEFLSKYIRYQIVNGKRYKDFAVAVPEESYFKEIENIFSKYEIPVYMDYTLSLGEVGVSKFFLKIFSIALNNLNKENLEYLISSPFLNLDNIEEKLASVDYYEIEEESDYKKNDNSLNEIFEIIKNIKKSKKIQEFCVFSEKICEIIEKNLNFYLEKIISLQKKSENEQAITLIKKIIKEIQNFKFDEEMALKDFIFLLETVFKSVKVETVPSYIDAVYVGDATKSYFEDVDTLFVVGATSSLLPKTEKDAGIIIDDELEKIDHLIEPEIRVINRRNRLKLFEVLGHAKKHLFTIVPLGNSAQKAGFVVDLEKAFNVKEVSTSSFSYFDRPDLKDESLQNLINFNLGTKETAERNFKKIESELKEDYASSINQVVGTDIFSYNYENLDFNPLKDKISASRLERYFVCPFKHFVSYTLKVEPKEYAKQDKRKIGILKHELAKFFVDKFSNLKIVKDEEIEKFLDEQFLISAKNTFDDIVLKDKIFINILRKECFNMLSNIVYEQQQSDFKPIYTEKMIKNSIKNLNFVGFVDRIDRFKNYFRIIDYKTGKVDGVLKDLYYGKKLQLFLYAKCVKEELKLEPSGVYYFDCKNKFKKKNVPLKLLDGLTLKDDEVAYASDYRFQDEDFKSDIIGGARRKESKDGFSFKYGNFINSFQKYFDYAEKVSEKAVEEIESGYIMPKPLEKECEFCEFKAICKFNQDANRKQVTKKDF